MIKVLVHSKEHRWDTEAVWSVICCVCLSDYEVNCRPAHGFIHVLPVTHNMSEFTRVIQEQRISGNMDTPEGGFDAMLQATVCQVNTPEIKHCTQWCFISVY